MATLVTEAIVLHAFDYLETSRILRLMTRDAGVQSVLARGARNSKKRFGSAVDLFAQGTAEIHLRDGRDLHSLVSLDVTRSRPQYANDVGRFTAGAMITELALRTSSDEPAPGLFDSIELALDRLSSVAADNTVSAALAGAWHIISTLGFTPAIDLCANCHADIDAAAKVVFSHRAGGALCARCGAGAIGSRTLPPEARSALRGWIEGDPSTVPLTAAAEKAHQRLLREFYQEHIGTANELKAFRVWESGAWTPAVEKTPEV